MKKNLGIMGEYDPTFPPHLAKNEAIEHAKKMLDADLAY